MLAVDLDQAVVGQIAGKIQIHHRLQRLAHVRPALPIGQEMGHATRAAHQPCRLLDPVALVDERIERIGGADAGGASGELAQPLRPAQTLIQRSGELLRPPCAHGPATACRRRQRSSVRR